MPNGTDTRRDFRVAVSVSLVEPPHRLRPVANSQDQQKDRSDREQDALARHDRGVDSYSLWQLPRHRRRWLRLCRVLRRLLQMGHGQVMRCPDVYACVVVSTFRKADGATALTNAASLFGRCAGRRRWSRKAGVLTAASTLSRTTVVQSVGGSTLLERNISTRHRRSRPHGEIRDCVPGS